MYFLLLLLISEQWGVFFIRFFDRRDVESLSHYMCKWGLPKFLFILSLCPVNHRVIPIILFTCLSQRQ